MDDTKKLKLNNIINILNDTNTVDIFKKLKVRVNNEQISNDIHDAMDTNDGEYLKKVTRQLQYLSRSLNNPYFSQAFRFALKRLKQSLLLNNSDLKSERKNVEKSMLVVEGLSRSIETTYLDIKAVGDLGLSINKFESYMTAYTKRDGILNERVVESLLEIKNAFVEIRRVAEIYTRINQVLDNTETQSILINSFSKREQVFNDAGELLEVDQYDATEKQKRMMNERRTSFSQSFTQMMLYINASAILFNLENERQKLKEENDITRISSIQYSLIKEENEKLQKELAIG